MIRIKDLFEIKTGVAKTTLTISNNKVNDEYIFYIRPSQTLLGSVDGFVDRSTVKKDKVFKKDTIYVSTDGEGSHTYSYVSRFEFVPNSNVLVLLPKREMNIRYKLFYAQCITANRFKFNYDRKPKGKRIKEMLVPNISDVPQWVENIELPKEPSKKPFHNKKVSIKDRAWDWDWFKLYPTLFYMKSGKYYAKDDYGKGNTYLISSSNTNNGVMAFTNLIPKFQNAITIGKIGASAFFQKNGFVASSDVTILIPKFNMNNYIAIFLVSLLNKETYKWSYGRQIRLNDSQKLKIKLPITKEGNPDWAFMEYYIKSLPYSSNLK